MATLVRRFLVVVALMFWMGGAIFYAAVVVPTGLHTIGLSNQVRVTGPVTRYVNLAGAVALLPLVWDVGATRDPSRRRRAARWFCWFVLAATLIALFGMHLVMDQELEAGMPTRGGSFHALHSLYLLVGGIEVVFALVYAAVTLAAWRAADGGIPAPVGEGQPKGQGGKG